MKSSQVKPLKTVFFLRLVNFKISFVFYSYSCISFLKKSPVSLLKKKVKTFLTAYLKQGFFNR